MKIEVKKRFQSELDTAIRPVLLHAGFTSRHRPPVNHWIRYTTQKVDVIELWWDKYQRPRFVYEFRSFDHPIDLVKINDNPKAAVAWDFGTRIFRLRSVNAWFRVNRLQYLFTPEATIKKAVLEATLALSAVLHFLNGGPPVSEMYDSHLWADPRIPDNPPPWSNGQFGSEFHLPSRRVGGDSGLWALTAGSFRKQSIE
jgi:hypothetical protein